MIETCIHFLLHKDNDIMEANVSLGEMQQKIKRLEGLCQVSIRITNRKIPAYNEHVFNHNYGVHKL